MIIYKIYYKDTKEIVLNKGWKRESTAKRIASVLSRRFNQQLEVIPLEVETSEEKLSRQLKDAITLIEMVEDHRKMPHQHEDLQTRLYCLTERAREFLEKYRGINEI